jgi:hypothetical protein
MQCWAQISGQISAVTLQLRPLCHSVLFPSGADRFQAGWLPLTTTAQRHTPESTIHVSRSDPAAWRMKASVFHDLMPSVYLEGLQWFPGRLGAGLNFLRLSGWSLKLPEVPWSAPTVKPVSLFWLTHLLLLGVWGFSDWRHRQR